MNPVNQAEMRSGLHSELVNDELWRLIEASHIEPIQRSAYEYLYGHPLVMLDYRRGCPSRRLGEFKVLQEELDREGAMLMEMEGAFDLTLPWRVERGLIVRDMASAVLERLEAAFLCLADRCAAHQPQQ